MQKFTIFFLILRNIKDKISIVLLMICYITTNIVKFFESYQKKCYNKNVGSPDKRAEKSPKSGTSKNT